MRNYLILTILLFPLLAAASGKYRIAPRSDAKTGVRFELPYSLGTHEADASHVGGELNFDGQNWSTATGAFQVPNLAWVNGDKKLECHLRESLGLDYEKSQFPESHVCDSRNELPATGPDAVVYPEIRFDWRKSEASSSDGATQVKVDGQWTIHGITRPTQLTLIASPLSGKAGLRLQGTESIRLEDFKITVKPFLFIKVKETARVFFDVELVPAQ